MQGLDWYILNKSGAALMIDDFDYIVVGSGCTGAMAAQTLTETGSTVAMLDVGYTDATYDSIIPNKDFLSLRRQDKNQYRYLIGKKLEGIAWGEVGKGEQITPPRKYILKNTDTLLPVRSKDFSVVESLAYGGLGSGWGIGCWTWSSAELRQAGLNEEKMGEAYQTVLNRIGISATDDDAQKYTIGNLTGYDESARLDLIHSRILNKYHKKKFSLNRQGFVMGRAPLALITKDRGERKKYAYKEMEYYTDKDKSAYRPWITIDDLKKASNFTYISNSLVLKFSELKSGVEVTALDTATKNITTYRAKKIILAAGVFGTARIVLRSQDANLGIKLPLLCNSYSYLPCIHIPSLGGGAEKHKLGFANLSLFLDEKGDNSAASMASLYGYQSLMLFRMARQVPLAFKEARMILQYLVSGLLIMGIHHPDNPDNNKYVSLMEDATSPTKDKLKISYKQSDEEIELYAKREKKYIKAVRSLGVIPLKKFNPGIGASIHYAGTLPYSTTPRPFTINQKGKLFNTKNVFIADGSGFNYLPAKGLTFSLMANAHNVAKEAIND